MHDDELVDVVGPRVARLRGDDRQLRGGTPGFGSGRSRLPGLELGEPRAVLQPARDRLVERQRLLGADHARREHACQRPRTESHHSDSPPRTRPFIRALISPPASR